MSSADRISKPTGGAISRIDTRCPQIGVVKQTGDSENMGRLRVWIKGSNTLENDPSGWITCSYASPFAGASDPEELGNNVGNASETQTSYGFWAVPPDLNNEVLVMFVNGDIRKAYWVAGIFQKDMNNMVPGIPSGASYQSGNFGNQALPTSEYNKLGNNPTIRPYYQTLAEGLNTQGLLSDTLRGSGNSGARRESPSAVYGMLTPGGNQFVMDDAVGGELIRLRTASGAQILISEAEGHVYAISRDGKSWGELNVDGNVDFYAGANCSFHALGDFNITAGGNVNIDAAGDINLKSGGSISALSAGNLNLTSQKNTTLYVNGRFVQTFIGPTQRWQTNGVYNVGDNYTHAGFTNNTKPKAITPKTYQQSVKNNANQEVPALRVTSRIPDREPWPLHAVHENVAPQGQEGDYVVSTGNVVPDAVQPLPVVGSPTKGMKQGVYTPQGYDKNQKPVYSFAGTSNEILPVDKLVTSQQGVNFIAGQEGFVPTPYNDAGKKAIGYGHNIIPSDPANVKTGPISIDTGLQVLATDLKKAEQTIKKYVKVSLSQSQFDALVSFIFNVGGGNFASSTLLKKLNAGDYADVPTQMMRWCHSQGKVLPVLLKRRRLEGLMFSTPVATS